MNPLDAGLYVSMILLCVATILTFYRVLRGPSLPDRVVALDMTLTLAAGITIVDSMLDGTAVLIDVSIVIALIAFLSTIAFAAYIERKERS
jgi:multicomponent Na+:H+ antiporter subunit F